MTWKFGEVQAEDLNVEVDTIQMVLKAKRLGWDHCRNKDKEDNS